MSLKSLIVDFPKPLPTRWFKRVSAATSFYAAFRPLFRPDRRWSASIPSGQRRHLLRQSHPAQQVGIAGVGTKWNHSGVAFDIFQAIVPLVVRPFKP